MGFITSDGVPDLSRSIISLWFRVPGSTIKAITEEYKDWQDEVEAANDAGDPPPPRPRRFLGIVPLMTFGDTGMKSRPFGYEYRDTGSYPPLVGHFYHIHSTPEAPCDGGWEDHPLSEFGPGYEGGPTGGYVPVWDGDFARVSFDIDGSYIGVDCMGKYPALSVNIIAEGKPTIEGTNSMEETFGQSAAWTVAGTALAECEGPHRYANFCYTETYVSQSQDTTKKGHADMIAGCCPETFRLLPAGTGGDRGVSNVDSVKYGDDGKPTYGGTRVTPDHWHHILLSLDLTGTVSANGEEHTVTVVGGDVSTGDGSGVGGSVSDETSRDKKIESSCQMYLAFDGRNKVGKELSVYSVEKNKVGTVNGFYVRESGLVVSYNETGMSIPKCRGIDMSRSTTAESSLYEFTTDIIDGSSIGLPADDEYVDAIKHVEMAELQIFTGVSIDTAEPRARQAFIYNGKPVPATKKWTEQSPFSGSIEYLTGVTDTDEGIRDRPPRTPAILLHGTRHWQEGDNTGTGQEFAPTGDIRRYKPDPSLGGDQGDPQ